MLVLRLLLEGEIKAFIDVECETRTENIPIVRLFDVIQAKMQNISETLHMSICLQGLRNIGLYFNETNVAFEVLNKKLCRSGR